MRSKMINEQTIAEVRERLVKAYRPLKIYLFGSYAWGCPDEESDLDILVIIDQYNKDRHQTLVEGHKALVDLYISKDILVYSKAEWDAFSKDKTKLCYMIKNKGKLIYGSA